MDIRRIADDELEQARQLLADNDWGPRVADAAVFRLLVQASPIALVAVENGRVIGFLRALTDGIFNAYISMTVVDRAHRRRGVGRALVEAAMATDPRMTWVLRAGRDGAKDFWAGVGFRPSAVAMERPGERITPLSADAYVERNARWLGMRSIAGAGWGAGQGVGAGARTGPDDPVYAHAPLAAVVYAHDVRRLADFYAQVLQLHLAREVEDSADAKSAADHLALSGRGMVLTLVAIHGGQGAGCQPQQPPVALEDTPLKLSFNVPDIEACRSRVTALGGVLKPLAAAWSWQGARHLDGVDPEGNVFQLRQRPG